MRKWYSLTNTQFDELLRLSRQYHREANRCLDAKAYIAGCAMAGAALEAVLMMLFHLYGSRVDRAGFTKMANGRPKPFLKWKLAELISTASQMGWLPSGLAPKEEWNGRKVQIGDYAEALRESRNLIHPARYLQDHSPSRVTRKYMVRAIEIFEMSTQYLNQIVLDSLEEKMKREERKSAHATTYGK